MGDFYQLDQLFYQLDQLALDQLARASRRGFGSSQLDGVGIGDLLFRANDPNNLIIEPCGCVHHDDGLTVRPCDQHPELAYMAVAWQ